METGKHTPAMLGAVERRKALRVHMKFSEMFTAFGYCAAGVTGRVSNYLLHFPLGDCDIYSRFRRSAG